MTLRNQLKMLLIIINTFFSVPTFAELKALLCSDPQSSYKVHLNLNSKMANLTFEDRIVRFGNLKCQEPDDSEDKNIMMYCRSPGVADAGYSIIFESASPASSTSSAPTHQVVATIHRMSYLGAKLIAVLPCQPTQN